MPSTSFPINQAHRDECLHKMATLYAGLNDQQKMAMPISYMHNPGDLNNGDASPVFQAKYAQWKNNTGQFANSLNDQQFKQFQDAMDMMKQGGYHFRRADVEALSVGPAAAVQIGILKEAGVDTRLMEKLEAVNQKLEATPGGRAVLLNFRESGFDGLSAQQKDWLMEAAGGQKEIMNLMQDSLQRAIEPLSGKRSLQGQDPGMVLPSKPDRWGHDDGMLINPGEIQQMFKDPMQVVGLRGSQKAIDEMVQGAGINAAKIENGPMVMADSKLDSALGQAAPATPKNTTFTV